MSNCSIFLPLGKYSDRILDIQADDASLLVNDPWSNFRNPVVDSNL